MAISRPGTATGTNTAPFTIPTHASGDSIVVVAWSNSAITAPAGWTLKGSALGIGPGVYGYIWERIAASSSETSGTFTGGSMLFFCDVYRGGKFAGTPAFNAGSSTAVGYPALTLTTTGGTSWAVRSALSFVDPTIGTTTLTGYTNRATAPAGNGAIKDSNGGLSSSPAAGTQTVANNGAWGTATFEIAEPITAIVLTPAAASFTVTGGTAALWTTTGLTPAGVSLSVSGGTPTLVRQDRLTPAAASLSVAGGTAGIVRSDRLNPSGRSFTLTGGTPTIGITVTQLLTPTAATFGVTGGTPTLIGGVGAQPAGRTFTVVGSPPTLVRQDRLNPSGRSLTLTLGTPVVTVAVTVNPVGRGLTLNAGTPTVFVTTNALLTPARALFTLTGGASGAGTGTVLVPTGGLPMVLPPTVSGDTFLILVPGTPRVVVGEKILLPVGRNIVLGGGTPTMRLTDHKRVVPAVVAMSVSGSVPVLTLGKTFTPTGRTFTMTPGAVGLFKTDHYLAQPPMGAVGLLFGRPRVRVVNPLAPLPDTPIERTVTVAADTRKGGVSADVRVGAVGVAENRTVVVAGEVRAVTISSTVR